MSIGERIRRIRKERGLTQKELGQKMGVADSAIRRYESDRAIPRPGTIEKMAIALGCQASDLSLDMDDRPLEWDDTIVMEESPIYILQSSLPDGYTITELPGWENVDSDNFLRIRLTCDDKSKILNLSEVEQIRKEVDDFYKYKLNSLLQ